MNRKDVENTPVHVQARRGGHDSAQRWRLIYADQLTGKDAYTKTGHMSKKGFNMIANKPFLLRSKLGDGRVASCSGPDVNIKKYVKGNKHQLWSFDPVGKGIRTLSRAGYGLKIEATNLRCQPIYSRWDMIFRW